MREQLSQQDKTIDAAVRGEIGSPAVEATDLGGGTMPDELDDDGVTRQSVNEHRQYAESAYKQYSGVSFHDIDENLLRAGWENIDKDPGLTWDEAKLSIQEAYQQMADDLEMNVGGRTDADGHV